MRYVIPVFAIVLVICALHPLGADQSATKAEMVARELIQLSGGEKMAKQVIEQLIETRRMMLPQVPGKFWEEFLAEVHVAEFTERVVPIYTRHLQVEDMRAAIAFYRTPAGQRLLEKQPEILQESMVVGQQWGMKMAMEIARRLQERGYKVEDI